MNRKRPHESPECRCAACVEYDREEADTPLWGFNTIIFDAHDAEHDAWEQFIALCDLAARI